MQPERSKGGDNYQHVVIRLRGPVVRARPKHDVVDTREVSLRFRVRVRESTTSECLHVFFFFCLVSFPPLFIAVSCYFFYNFKV